MTVMMTMDTTTDHCYLTMIDPCCQVSDIVCMLQGSYRSGKTGKSQGICVVREMSGKNIILEKSGKMILDHADCR